MRVIDDSCLAEVFSFSCVIIPVLHMFKNVRSYEKIFIFLSSAFLAHWIWLRSRCSECTRCGMDDSFICTGQTTAADTQWAGEHLPTTFRDQLGKSPQRSRKVYNKPGYTISAHYTETNSRGVPFVWHWWSSERRFQCRKPSDNCIKQR